MTRYLVVANQTLGGADLDRAVRKRVEQGDAHFHIVVPMIEPKEEAPAGGWSGAPSGDPSSDEFATADKARRRAQDRLQRVIGRIKDVGGEASGEVGDSDPAQAVKEALKGESFDEVIVSTLPARLSRWLKMDLPSRVSRMTDVPVTTVEAEG